jgi:GNAT superfamily N-acetyltransferase
LHIVRVVSDLPVLGRDALAAVAALCRRGIPGSPSLEELDGALFSPEQPAVVRGDPQVGVVATVDGDGGGYMRLLVVDPGSRGRGHGHALVRAAQAEARAAGHRTLTIGSDAPFFLWPGVPSDATELLCLFERHRYARVDTNFDMTIDLTAIPADPGGHGIAQPGDRSEVDAWMATHWPNWRAEVLRALDKGNLVLTRDRAGIRAFCAFEVNRAGFLGPVAARPDLIGRGAARPGLVGALHELRRRGRDSIDVCWVGPVVPYAALGGRVSNVYFVYRRELA